ncbi:serine/threonine-protein kinase ULK1 isoform X1 [Oryctolagus cuniculus]|uniref:serine/threonine-protein kinase ULK1 isoform X1 n=1 Tax=Oryctolagus cuniculus TaxID=9986 RepID=UPI00222F120F|nr:serine/threonine-protein kinase ULK1 isoform X1 [Oryctolagus cuniculus]
MEPGRGGIETVGKFEFSRKDLIGHGAFAVVFKGRHREKHDLEVAVKCINKKNLAKSQTLLGKEIKILKELKHENIVALYDFQEMANSVYLVMEYCNGGDLADYLHTMRTLSEDTIRLFLQQIAGAMRLLHSKGIIHRDLKPQNILLANPGGRRANPSNIRVKIADFGFARYLQSNMMAATLCGSPMYMAPEVIMSQHYDGKADLWSIGTIVYQCLTGKAPFQASSPQDLRLFYEKNKTLVPTIPRETSAPLRQLLLALLQRNHKERMDFDEFFHHPFLDASASVKKSPPVPVPSYPSSGSGSSSSSSCTSHLASPPSLGEMPPLQKTLTSPAAAAGFLHGSRDSGGSSKDSCDTDDFVMVPAQFPGDLVAEAAGAKPLPDSLLYSGSSLVASAGLDSHGRTPSPSPPCSSTPSPSGRAGPFSSSRCGASVPIPVPTQVHNYQRIEQNLQSPTQHQAPRSSSRSPAIRRSGSTSPLSLARASPSPPAHTDGALLARKLSLGGGRPYTPSPQVGAIPERLGWSRAPSPQAAEMRTGRSPRPGSSAPEHSPRSTGLGYRLHSAPNLSDLHVVRPKLPKPPTDPLGVAFSPPQASPPQPSHGLQSCRPLRGSPKLPDFLQRNPLPPILGSPTKAMSSFDFPKTPSSQNLLTLLARQGMVMTPPRNRTLPDLSEVGPFQGQQLGPGLRPTEDARGPVGRSFSTSRLTDLLLRAAFGTQASDWGSTDSLQEKPMDTAPSAGFGGNLHPGARAGGASSPAPVVFTVGSPPSGTTPPQGPRTAAFSVGPAGSSTRPLVVGACGEAAPELPAPGHCCSFADPIAANLEGAVTFEAPDLPEETLMEQEHTEILHSLRFTLVFVQHVLEIAALKGSASEAAAAPESQLQESVVADQISLLSREWGFAEQLVLYLKVAELLSAGLQTAIDQIRAGKLCLSSTVKQVVRKLNALYKASVVSCQGLRLRLQRFFLDKQRLLDRVHSITAEKLIFSHAVQMVQSAALDEMFQHHEGCVPRYHKALLLLEGLQQLLSDQADIENIAKCKLCIERRLSALLTGIGA